MVYIIISLSSLFRLSYRCCLNKARKQIAYHLGLGLSRRPWSQVDRSLRLVHCADFSSSARVNARKDAKDRIESIPKENIRNFSIIAHVDHGKSTLSDRLLEFTGTISTLEKNEQLFLDKLQVEKERGITVKAQNASMLYTYNGQDYLLNLVDTPGHVDFSYEVARSLAACQGAILLVDANQGVQAQTVANFNLAFLQDLKILTALNKIDLKNAKPETVIMQMQKLFDVDPAEVIKLSAKFGTGVQELIEAVINKIPPPPGDPEKPFRGFLFDSCYDKHRGVISLVTIVDGKVQVGDEVTFSHTGQSYVLRELGVLHPDETPTQYLNTGQMGYIIANMRNFSEAKLGDTIHHKNIQVESLPPLKTAKPMVYAGLYPADQTQNSALRSAVGKLALNDPSVSMSVDGSPALGQGWRLGFLGLLHMEVFSQRLEQEFDAPVVVTAPSVPYRVRLKAGKHLKQNDGEEEIIITNPLKLPERAAVAEYFEPMVLATIITPDKHFGDIMSLCMERRGVQKNASNIDDHNIMLLYKLPLSEVIVDFFDELKTISSGYASFDYEDAGYETTDIVKMDILLNGKIVDELSSIVHTSKVQKIGKQMVKKLSETIPPQLFLIAIQAAVGSKIVARENIKALRKNVLAKCYGGDITRKMKLLKRQAEGKAKMRMIGNVEVPRDTFIKVLKK